MAPDPAELLTGLDPEQRAAVMHESTLLAIMAPAGSGKTRTLTRRIAYRSATGSADARRVLAVTFTRKAAGELRARLSGPLGCGDVTAGTFHSLALGQLRRRAADAGRGFPALLERKARILAPMVGGRGAQATVAINEVAGEIEWAKARALVPGDYADAATRSGRPLPRPADELAGLYERYEQEKRRRRLVDFDDLLWWCADALEHDADFAAATRFRFRHLFVDEFQDVTPAQLRVLRGWLGARLDLTVVGDEAQSIYSFAGAQAGVLSHFERFFPGAVTVRLATNYRSTPQIVAVADAILDASSGAQRRTPHAPRDPGPAPRVRQFADAAAEAVGVAAAAKRAHDRGTPWREIAILYRTNAQSAEFETALRAAGVPFRLRSATRFMDRPEVRVVLDELTAGEQAAPGRPLADLLVDLAARTPAPGPDALDDPGRATLLPPADEPDDPAVREHRSAVVALAREFLAIDGGRGSVQAFLAWMESSTRSDDPLASDDVVELSTFHAAKGLEWEHVFVTGIEQGLVPISYARTPEARAEEQRLFHVALSRAGAELEISWAAERVRPRKPSPWLELVEAAAAGRRVEELRPPPNRKAEIARAKATLRAAAPSDADPAVLAALKEWRLALSRANGVPAYTIFTDRTLADIAATRPSTPAALLACHGVGDAKLERWGAEVLAIVGRHTS